MCFKAHLGEVFGKESKIVKTLSPSSTSNCSRSFKQSMSQGGEHARMSEDVKDFRNAFLDIREMVKVLYEERNSKFQGESSRTLRGECSPREERNRNCDKPSSSRQCSCFSTTIMQDASVESPSEKVDGQVCTFFTHDVEYEVLSAPKSKLKEES